MRRHYFLFICLAGIIFTGHAQERKNQGDLNPGRNEIMLRLSDGVELATDVYLPKKKGKHPTVLVRTPYNKSSEAWMEKAFEDLGIVAVVQDVRGKFKSSGEFYGFINERTDGLQTLRWIRDQPWSDGKVAGWGGSYVGYTQWAISDSLNFLTPLLTGATMYDLFYPDSLLSLHLAFIWGFLNASQTINTIQPEKLAASLTILPLSVADDSTIKDIPLINDFLRHEKYDAYWKKMDHRGITKSQLISIAGWYDIFLQSQITDFEALAVTGNPANRMVIGPWCHGNQGEKNEYGGLIKTGKPDLVLKYMMDWLAGKKITFTSPLRDKKYNLFIMERNEYVGSDRWPPEETRIVPYFLGPSGYLGTSNYKDNGELKYEYNPSDPYPSIGGTILGEGVGPARQNPNVNRRDQIVFEMNVTDKPLTLLGPLTATLWLSSDVPCTDFIVGLQDVFPDGKIINIQEGGAKVSFGSSQPEVKKISVWATGYQVNPGHKLRVFIASSWFPRYNRSLNTCEPISDAKNIVSAHQKVWYGAPTPSSINLPVYEADN
jgi:putative CocE/NonD family hydrolase